MWCDVSFIKTNFVLVKHYEEMKLKYVVFVQYAMKEWKSRVFASSSFVFRYTYFILWHVTLLHSQA